MASSHDSSNKFGISAFSGSDHDILLKISNARGGFCLLVIINLKYGSQNTQKSPSVTCFTKPKGLCMQTLAWDCAHGLHKPLVYRQTHSLAVVSQEYDFCGHAGLTLVTTCYIFLKGRNICKYLICKQRWQTRDGKKSQMCVCEWLKWYMLMCSLWDFWKNVVKEGSYYSS